MPADINAMPACEAAKWYQEHGFYVHPLNGKIPILKAWQERTEHLSEHELTEYFETKNKNIGLVCGEKSDTTVIDRDHIPTGLWQGLELSPVRQSRTEGRDHLFYRYCAELPAAKYHALGFEILNGGNNCVLAPSIHPTGDKYQIIGSPDNRPEMPEALVERIKSTVDIWNSLQASVNRCRPAFRKMFNAYFIDNQKTNHHYRNVVDFRGATGRELQLFLFAELKANGASDDELDLLCKLIFLDGYDKKTSEYQISKISDRATVRTETIQTHPILSRFFDDGDDNTYKPASRRQKHKLNNLKEVKNEYVDLVDVSNSGKVSLSSSGVADYITRKLNVISYKETLYTYSEGYYKEGSETIKALIIKIVRETGAKASIREVTRDVLHYIMYNDPFTDYPFNSMFGYVPFKNGVVHLDFERNAFELVEHDPKYRFNWQIPHDFDPSNKGDVIHRLMIGRYVSEDEQPILYQVPAQAILQAMGVHPYKKGYLFDGPANAGKTTMTDLYEVAFGVSNVSHQSLQALNTTENKFSIACLEGKLLNCYDDLSNIPLKDSGTFKTITGKEWHDIEKKGQQQYSARLFAVHVFTCNAPPMFDSKIKKDHAFWERWEYVHFFKTFVKDPLFYDRVFTEENVAGFLYRVLKTCIDIYNNGLYVNSTVEEVREKWSFNSDPVYRYLNEHIEPSSKCDYVDKDDLLKKITAWALKTGVDIEMIPLSVKGLTTRLELYDVVADKKVNTDGIRVEVYRLNGVLSEAKGLQYLPKKITVKTQQGGFN